MASTASSPISTPRHTISEQISPVEVIFPLARDGQIAGALVRRPPGPGPFPVLLHLHGGLAPMSLGALKGRVMGLTASRFLAAGYIVVAAGFRSRVNDPLTPDALLDFLAIAEHVRAMAAVDPHSVVVWGDSGGGSLALELAGETALCAISVQEPATVLFTARYSKEMLGPGPAYQEADGNYIMEDPQRYYTPEIRQRTVEKIERIRCPILVAHSDIHIINKLNTEIFIPELRRAGKHVETVYYPGEPHGFSARADPAAARFFEDSHAFFGRYLPTQPVAIEF